MNGNANAILTKSKATVLTKVKYMQAFNNNSACVYAAHCSYKTNDDFHNSRTHVQYYLILFLITSSRNILMAIIRVNSVPLDFRCPLIPRLRHNRLLIEDAYFISLCATKMSPFLGHPVPVLQIHKLLLAHLQQSLLWNNIFVWLKI